MERTGPIWERWLAVGGIAYVFVHFFFLTTGVGPDAGVGAVQKAFVQSPRQEMVSGVLFQVSALALLLFAVSLWAHLRPAENERKTLSSIVLGAAFAYIVLAFAGSTLTFALESKVARLGDANLTFTLVQLWWGIFLGALCIQGILVMAASASALITRMFPRWVGWLGIACGVALMAGCLAFYPTGAVVEGPADGIAYIGEIMFAIWSIAASITILRGRRLAATVARPGLSVGDAMAR